MVKKIIAVIFFCFLLNIICFSADLSTFYLSDSVYNKPNITTFFYCDNADGISVQAYLDNEQLQIKKIGKASELELKTNYIFLIDESTSISQIQMSKIREALSAAADSITDMETMTVVTFGEDIEIKADHITDKNELKNVANSIINDKGGTVFFDVIKRAGEICRTAPNDRNLVFVISDGADFAVGGNTYDEIQQYVKRYGITLFAIALGTTSNPNIDKFGQLARSSSGFIAVCELETIDDNILMLMDKTRNSNVIVMKSSSNNVSSSDEKLLVKFSTNDGEISFEKTLFPDNWVKDETAPVITALTQTSDTSIAVTFSEDVLNAGNVENYSVMLNDKYQLEADSVSYDSSTHTANIIFKDGIFRGLYNVMCYNITDNSMEKNPVSEGISREFTGRSYQSYLIQNKIATYWLVFLIIAIVIILLITGIITYKVIAARKGIVIHEKKIKFRDSMVDKEHIIAPVTTDILLIVTDSAGIDRELNMKMYKSIIVGRDPMCDLSFNDALLSRQHFAIEEVNDVYTIMDLNTTNGTLLNGVPLRNRHRLSDGDVIQAGNEKFTYKVR